MKKKPSKNSYFTKSSYFIKTFEKLLLYGRISRSQWLVWGEKFRKESSCSVMLGIYVAHIMCLLYGKSLRVALEKLGQMTCILLHGTWTKNTIGTRPSPKRFFFFTENIFFHRKKVSQNVGLPNMRLPKLGFLFKGSRTLLGFYSVSVNCCVGWEIGNRANISLLAEIIYI